MKLLYVIAALFVTTACATTPPPPVPEVECNQYAEAQVKDAVRRGFKVVEAVETPAHDLFILMERGSSRYMDIYSPVAKGIPVDTDILKYTKVGECSLEGIKYQHLKAVVNGVEA